MDQAGNKKELFKVLVVFSEKNGRHNEKKGQRSVIVVPGNLIFYVRDCVLMFILKKHRRKEEFIVII